MTTTVGASKQLSDQVGTVKAGIHLSSDRVLPNPMAELSSVLGEVYRILGLGQEFFMSECILTNVVSSKQNVYSFNVKFSKPGAKLSTISSGFEGPSGARGPRGPIGPAGPGFEPSGDLSGDHDVQVVVGIKGRLLPEVSDGFLAFDGDSWEFKTPIESQKDSTATSLASLRSDFNSFLAKLRASGMMKNA